MTKGTKVNRVEITSRGELEFEASNAKVYIGGKLCGTLPEEVEKSKVYTFKCDTVGDYVKIVTGRNDTDQRLTFSNVAVYAANVGGK